MCPTCPLSRAPHDGLGELIPARGDCEHILHDKGAAGPGLVVARVREDGADAVVRGLERVMNEVDELGLGGRGTTGKRHLGVYEAV